MYNQQKRPIRKTGRPWLELGVEDVPSNIARTKGRPAVGVLVTGLHSKAALEAGLKNGDIIVAINHRVVYNQKELFSFIERESKPYDVVMLRVIRDDEGMDIPMKLGSTGKESKIRQEVQESIPVITLKCPYCGVDVSNVSETCPQCGKELWFPNQKGNATYPKKSKKKSISSHGLLSEKPIAYKIKRAVVSLSGKIYSNPDITSSAISKIQEDEKVIILEESGEFYKVRLEANSEVTGYLEKDLFASKWAVVSLNGPMFAEPDIASSPVCEVFKGDKLIILDETEKYCHVKLETERSISGYITKELLGPIERRESKTSDIVAYQSTNPMTSIHSTIKNDQASQPKQSDAAVYKALKRKHAEAKEDFSRLRLSRGLIGFFLGLVFVVLAFVNFFFKVNNNPFLSWSELQSTVFYSIILIIIGLVIAIIIGAPVREAGKRVKELNQRLRDYEQKQALGYNSSGVVRTAST